MRKLVILFAFFWLILVSSSSAAPKTDRHNKVKISTGNILVHFKKNSTTAQQNTILHLVGGRRIKTIEHVRWSVVSVPESSLKSAQQKLQSSSIVKAATEPVFFRPTSITPTDPSSLTGPVGQKTPIWPLTNIRLPDAWTLTLGRPRVIVAVIDSGVQPNHADIPTLSMGYNFVDNNTDTTDLLGHGTGVAGIIGARGDNAKGVAGVCWLCTILPIKVIGNYGGNWGATDANVAAAIIWATDHGAQIINLSLGSTHYSAPTATAVSYAEDHDVIVVAAAGNDDANEMFYPAAYPGVVSVAGTNQDNARYIKSRDGWGSNYGSWIQLAAPGCTTAAWLATSSSPDGAYVSGFCGTSIASPYVAGVAALAISYSPSSSPTEIVEALKNTAHQGDGSSSYGIIDADAALEELQPAEDLTPPSASFVSNSISGIDPLSVSFVNNSSDTIYSHWDIKNPFDDICTNVPQSSEEASPIITFRLCDPFNTSDEFNVTLTVVGSGGISRTSSAITVNAPIPDAPETHPVASFSISSPSGRAPLGINFTNTSTDSTAYTWDFGDGATSEATSPSHTYTQTGTYTVTLTATSNVEADTTIKTIVVSTPLPQAAFTINTTSGYLPLITVFSNSSSDSTAYTWDFGDGATSEATSPSHTYTQTGTYTVTLTARSSEGAAASSKTVIVLLPLPETNFEVSTTSGEAPKLVDFANTSINATSYNWTFGDGSSSNKASPSHIFTSSGTFKTTLTATNTRGSTSKSITINISASSATTTTSSATTTPDTTKSPTSKAKPNQDLTIRLLQTKGIAEKRKVRGTFVAKVKNIGAAGSTPAGVTLLLPTGATFQNITPTRLCKISKNKASCQIGSLAASAATKIEFKAFLPNKAKLRASINSPKPEMSTKNNSSTLKTTLK